MTPSPDTQTPRIDHVADELSPIERAIVIEVKVTLGKLADEFERNFSQTEYPHMHEQVQVLRDIVARNNAREIFSAYYKIVRSLEGPL